MADKDIQIKTMLLALLVASMAVNIALVVWDGDGQSAERAVSSAAESDLQWTAAEPDSAGTVNTAGAAYPVRAVVRGGDLSGRLYMVAADKGTVRKSLFANFYSTPTDIVFLGDSLTEQFEWGDVFPEYNVKNRGIAGDTTGMIVSRLDSVVKLEPGKVFVMAGINDVGAGVGAQRTIQNYESIVATLCEQVPLADLYILSILPAGDLPNVNNQLVRDLNGQIAELCDQYGITYIDLFSRMALDDMSLDPQYHYDNLHLNERGYAVWVEEIVPYVYAGS